MRDKEKVFARVDLYSDEHSVEYTIPIPISRETLATLYIIIIEVIYIAPRYYNEYNYYTYINYTLTIMSSTIYILYYA